MLRLLMSSGSFLPFVLFAGPNEGAPGGVPPGGQGDPPAGDDGTPSAGGDGTPSAGEGDGGAGDAGGGDGTDDEGDGTGGDGAGDGAAPPVAGATPPAGAPDWRDREIGRKHRQIQESRNRELQLQRELEDAKALLARQPGGEPPAGGDGTPPARPAASTVDQNAVQREARKIVAKETYDQQCNDVYEKGGKEYKDKWDPALERLNVLGGLGEGQDGVDMMTSVLAADNPSQVLFKLGSNPDEYHRVMALSPAKRMAEVIKLGLTPAAKPAPRPDPNLPDPVEPVSRRARTSDPEPLDTDDDPTWYAKRARQKAERWAAKQAGQRPRA